MKDLLQRFNPFFFPKDNWEHRKYITLNTFKGYKMFDTHYWEPQERGFLNGGEQNSKQNSMIGATLFHYRLELFFAWKHLGPSWKK